MVRLFSCLECAQFGVFGGTCISLTTSCCHSVGFCIVLCVVQHWIIWQFKFAILLEAMLKLFSGYFYWEQNEMEKNWWRKCQSSEGICVPAEIQIWAWHSGVFCFQIFCILPVLLSLVCGYKNWKYSNVAKKTTFFLMHTLICIWV